MMDTEKRKLVVIGLDGGTLDVIEPLIAQGRLPNLARIKEGGVIGPLRSVIPPRSAPAWIGFMTGWNPGRHGVLDFWRRDWHAYSAPSTNLVTSEAFAGQTVWDYAGAAGWRVGVVTVPVTYPAWQVNGFMLSGYLMSPGMNARAAYPSSLAERYSGLNFPEAYRKGASREEVMREGPRMIRSLGQAAAELQREYDCELLIVVLGPVDKAQHDFWRYREPDCPAELRARYGDVIDQHYEVADEVIGQLWQQMGVAETNVVVISDHGGGPYPRRCFQTNYALYEHGLLAVTDAPSPAAGLSALRTLRFRLRGDLYHRLKTWGQRLLPRRTWDGLVERYRGLASVDWGRTRCYRVRLQAPAEGIMVNLKGRQPQGIVAPGAEYEAVREQVIAAMSDITDPETGARIVAGCYRREELFSGPFVEEMPDILMVLQPGYKGDDRLDAGRVSLTPAAELERFRGEHTMDGIFLAAGPDFRRGGYLEGANLLDVPPTLLYLLDVPVPDVMDGQVLRDALSKETLAARPLRWTAERLAGQAVAQPFTADEEREVLDRLAGLGYLE